MRPTLIVLGVPALLLLAACHAPERAPPPYFVIPPGPAGDSAASPVPGAATRGAPQTRNPSVQYFLPARPEDAQRAPSPVPRPGAASVPFPSTASPNPGPVTGYGPGGMAQPPGAPPNPPYPPGGLSAPRP